MTDRQARRVENILIARHYTGWTLDYIDSLDPLVRKELWGVVDSEIKIRQTKAHK